MGREGAPRYTPQVEVRPELEPLKPEVLGLQCGARFIRGETEVDERGASSEGFLSCDVTECTIKVRRITGNVDAGVSGAAARMKVDVRARRQMSLDCFVWTQDSENIGKEMPDDRLPQALRRV